MKSLPIHQINIKTSNVVSYNYLIELYLSRGVPIVICGPMGTGKTALMTNYYQQEVNSQDKDLLEMVFSSATFCKNIQGQLQ